VSGELYVPDTLRPGKNPGTFTVGCMCPRAGLYDLDTTVLCLLGFNYGDTFTALSDITIEHGTKKL
jgi:hypothetical protein